jgi:hypothetical protein
MEPERDVSRVSNSFLSSSSVMDEVGDTGGLSSAGFFLRACASTSRVLSNT